MSARQSEPSSTYEKRHASAVSEDGLINISVVVPVYNEEQSLPVLIPRIVDVLGKLGKSYEMIFVDDGSTDQSRAVLRTMAFQYPELRLLGFKMNCGETAASAAGMREARGKIVITMDADLQNDPRDIPGMLVYLEDYDMVTGWRQKREDS